MTVLQFHILHFTRAGEQGADKGHFHFLDTTQVPETSVNRDGGVREKFMFPPSILTQGSVDWGFLQISTGRILHSGPNLR